MALATKLELRQSQQLVMTPQLQQAIRLLQFSNFELAQFVEAEIERNPLLERDESRDDLPQEDAAFDGPQETPARGERPDDVWLERFRPEPGGPEAPEADRDNAFPDAAPSPSGLSWGSTGARGSASPAPRPDIEAVIAANVSLKDHLDHQLALAALAPPDRIIGQCLVDMIDEAGYLTAGVESLAAMLGAAVPAVEKVLAVLQTFEPPGVFARSLPECLALQLKERNRFDPLMAVLLDHLDLVAAHDLAALRKAVATDGAEILEMIAEIKELDPKPGLKYGAEPIRPVVPDVFVRASNGHGWTVELNADTLPRVLVNRAFCATVARGMRSERDQTYLQNCMQTANWLTRSLDQRARTILRVAEEIVRQQHAFFAHGVDHLRPLNLRTVADAISMHESTVSRVTSNKYVATPRGTFELKYFFTSAIKSADDGEARSSETVRQKIRRLIDEETPRSVLSDDKIVELLKASGIDIARRTVAKYRDALRIPSSVQRRRAKRLAKSRV